MPAEVIIDSPFTRVGESFFTWQNHQCARFEMRWMKCLSASGMVRGKDFCQDYFEDYYECVHHYKSNLRVWKMREVRKKTGRPFLEPPAFDTWNPHQPKIRIQVLDGWTLSLSSRIWQEKHYEKKLVFIVYAQKLDNRRRYFTMRVFPGTA